MIGKEDLNWVFDKRIHHGGKFVRNKGGRKISYEGGEVYLKMDVVKDQFCYHDLVDV